MLTIRMQRTGRKGLANFRVIVQDSQFSPTSGRVVATVGSYNPHTKETVLEKEAIETYLKNGAQPSERVVRLLTAEKIKLPSWVAAPNNDNKRSIKNPEKLRKNQPEAPEQSAEEPAAEEATTVEAPAETTSTEASEAQSSTESTDSGAAEKPSEESEKPAEEAPEKTEADTSEEPSDTESEAKPSAESDDSGAEEKPAE